MLSQSKKDNTTTKVSPHPLWIVSSETAPIAGTGALNQEPTLYETVDRLAHAQVAKATSGLAPSALAEAYLDWAIHLAISPGKQMQLMEAALKKRQNTLGLMLRCRFRTDMFQHGSRQAI